MVKLRSLEMLRGVAALLVVLFHTQAIFAPRAGHTPFANLFGAGNRGVDLFFVLSGFIIAYVHADDAGRPRRLGHYAFNRLARIYPTVWIMTALAIGLYAAGFGGADKAAKLAPAAIAASALLLPQHGDALVNVTWTLTYELFFYAMFAVVIVNRRIGLALLLLWQEAVALSSLSGTDLGPAGYYTRAICLEFGLGMACAWWLRRSDSTLHPAAWFALLAGGIAGFVAGMALNGALPWSGAACALGAAAAILALARLEQSGSLRPWAPLMRLGGASYAIYLVHFSTITVLSVLLARIHLKPTDAVCLACAASGVIAGLVFDRTVDQPTQRWLRRQRRVLEAREWPRLRALGEAARGATAAVSDTLAHAFDHKPAQGGGSRTAD